MRPLHVLVFLLPLIGAYELGSFLYLHDVQGRQMSVSAQKLFVDFFHAFGLAGASLPSVTLITVFLAWHVMVKDRWHVDPNTLGGMLLESIAWTLPLLVLSATVVHAQRAMGMMEAGNTGLQESGGIGAAGGMGGTGGAGTIGDLPAMARLTISVGAGLYEEMLFRLVGLALMHFVLVDLIGVTPRWGYAIAIFICALAFALYHQGQGTTLLIFRTLAGVYLGTVYVMRGFGIVVGTHALFDVLALVILPAH